MQSWTKREREMPVRAALGAPGTMTQVPALRAFSLELSQEMHYLSFGISVDSNAVRLGFANWRPRMLLSHPAALFSFRRAGSAKLVAEVVMLSFEDAEITLRTLSGTQSWPGWGRSADRDAAITGIGLE
jgi:hypothetical protein